MVYRFTFTGQSIEYIELGGNGAPNTPSGAFAYLDFDTTTNQFRLYDGPNAYLGSSVLGQGVCIGLNGVAFSLGSSISSLDTVSYPSSGTSVTYDNGSMLGLTSVIVPNVIAGNFNLTYKALNNENEVITDDYKLIAGESETFKIIGFDESTLANLKDSTFSPGQLILLPSSVAVRVQSSTGNGVSWFTATSVSAVPEISNLILILFGLFLIYFNPAVKYKK